VLTRRRDRLRRGFGRPHSRSWGTDTD